MRFSLMRKSKSTIILAISAFVLFLVVLSGYIFWSNLPFNWTKHTIESPKVRINYPKAFERTNIDKDEAESQSKRETLFRATEGEKLTKTPFVTSLSKETGLRIVTSLTRIE